MSKRARRKMQRKLKSMGELHEIAVDPKFFDKPLTLKEDNKPYAKLVKDQEIKPKKLGFWKRFW